MYFLLLLNMYNYNYEYHLRRINEIRIILFAINKKLTNVHELFSFNYLQKIQLRINKLS